MSTCSENNIPSTAKDIDFNAQDQKKVKLVKQVSGKDEVEHTTAVQKQKWPQLMQCVSERDE